MVQIAGIFSWDEGERRSNRYGSFYMALASYNIDDFAPIIDSAMNASLDGKRVRIVAEVVQSRVSGHIGDLFLGIVPSQPEVGEKIDLGVGFLKVGKDRDKAKGFTYALEPNDGRKELWMDPRLLYRLHDQVVRVSITETDEDFTPAPDLKGVEEIVVDGIFAFHSKLSP